jgi:alpha-beta hydrolase superfamily lysophospholipase
VNPASLFLPVGGTGDELHVRHFVGARPASGAPILMIHGAVENGRIFYPGAGGGLAPFLAARGHDVYVADLRGRGQSRPRIGPGARHSQTDLIVGDLPALAGWVRARHPDARPAWITHSWGGVLALSCLARFPALASEVAGLVNFGTKRCVRAKTAERLLKIELIWKRAAPMVAHACGYLPARKLGWGSDDETVASLRQSIAWVRPGPWVDPEDGFDYGAALRTAKLPPILWLAADGDRALGHPDDVRRTMAEVGSPAQEFRLLRGFDHVSMVVGPRAAQAEFPRVAEWIGARV